MLDSGIWCLLLLATCTRLIQAEKKYGSGKYWIDGAPVVVNGSWALLRKWCVKDKQAKYQSEIMEAKEKRKKKEPQIRTRPNNA